ncbi:MAG: DUF2953 domain-containing protein [Faecousia sp.]
MGWLIALAILVLPALLPLGVSVKYDADGPLVKMIAGPVRVVLYPLKKRKPKKQAKPREEKPAEQKTSSPTKPQQKQGGSLSEFLPLVQLAVDFLGDFRRKLRVNRLEMRLIMAADDPCDLAVNYGRAWAAVGNLMPRLERLFVIKKKDVQVACDFEAEQTTVSARLDLTITLGRLLALVSFYGVRAVMEYLNIMNQRKGGAQV